MTLTVPDPSTPKPAPAPQRVPADPLRRIDWLAVAPWLLLLRVPGVAASWRVWLLCGAACVLGGLVNTAPVGASPNEIATAALEGVFWPYHWITSVGDFFDSPRTTKLAASGDIIATIFFAALVFVVASRAFAARLTNLQVGSPLWLTDVSLLRSVGVLFTSCLLVAIPLSVTYLVGWFLAWLGLSAMWPLTSLAVLLAVAAVAVATAATPLAAVAISVEDCDAFDAVSRGVAYATQCLGRLAFYIALAAALGYAAGLLLESLIALHDALLRSIATRPTGAIIPVKVWDDALRTLLRGYYVAYWVAAATAIYLLLRQDIDGQPLDEMARLDDQASEPA